MIWMSNVSVQSIFLVPNPRTLKDYKCSDDLDVECQFAIDILNDKHITLKDYKCSDDLDV